MERPGPRPERRYLLGICLRALHRVLPRPDPVVVSAFYLRPGVPGPARVHTELVRAGRRTATGEARLVQDGAEVVRAVATFGDLATVAGRTLLLGGSPTLPAPSDGVDPMFAGRHAPGHSGRRCAPTRHPIKHGPGWTSLPRRAIGR